MTIDTNWIEENIILHKLDHAAQALLNEVFETITYQAGDEIISQHSSDRGIYILRSGLAAITQQSGNSSLCLGYADEGALFGEMSFLTEKQASATVTAHSNCLVYKLSFEGYCTLITKNQELLLSLFTYMLNYSGELIRRMNIQLAEQS